MLEAGHQIGPATGLDPARLHSECRRPAGRGRVEEGPPHVTGGIRQHAPPRPKLIALSGDLDVGHPLTRRVDGVWVGQPHSLWLMLSAQLLIDNKRGDAERLRAYQQGQTLNSELVRF